MVGLGVLFLTAALLSTLLWLSVGFDQKTYVPYIVYMPESANSLSEDSPVKYNGVKVGVIKHIRLSKSDPQMVELFIMVQEGTLITTSTQASLVFQGITGTSYLGLTASSPTLTPLKRTGNAPYPVIPYKRSFFGELQENATELSKNLKKVFDEQNTKNIKKTLACLEEIMSAISKNSAHIDKTLSELPKAVATFETTVEAIRKVTKNIAYASSQVSKTMQAGKDGINQFTEQTLPPATMLMQRLDVIAANLEQVSSLLKQDPSVIIRGTSPEKPGPGE